MLNPRLSKPFNYNISSCARQLSLAFSFHGGGSSWGAGHPEHGRLGLTEISESQVWMPVKTLAHKTQAVSYAWLCYLAPSVESSHSSHGVGETHEEVVRGGAGSLPPSGTTGLRGSFLGPRGPTLCLSFEGAPPPRNREVRERIKCYIWDIN